jgi:RNA polymerase sigma factor (sigma-70 family)
MSGDPREFEQFYRDCFASLLRDVLFMGGHRQEAEDALSAAMLSTWENWDRIENPHAYARKAALNHLIKARQRGQWRIRARMIARGAITFGAVPVPGTVIWEQQQWVTELLASLPPAQRQVLACAIDAITPQETALLLGKTPGAVRQCLRAARERLKKDLAENDGA